MAKLIRDLVPAVIEEEGRVPLTMEATREANFVWLLKQKLVEEAHEVGNARRDEIVDEMADVLEVLWTLANVLDISRKEVEEARLRKKADFGGFDNRIVLLGVMEKETGFEGS